MRIYVVIDEGGEGLLNVHNFLTKKEAVKFIKEHGRDMRLFSGKLGDPYLEEEFDY